MDFWLWISFPFLVFGILSFIKEGKAVENGLFSKQRWGIRDCVCFLALLLLSFMVLKTISEYLPIHSRAIIGKIIGILVVITYVRYKLKQPLITLGLHTSHLSENILYGLKGILPWILISIIVSLSVSVYSDTPEVFGEERRGVPWITLLIRLISADVFAPLREELIYRGFFYGPIRRRVSRKIAVLLSSAIFASFHMDMMSRPPIHAFLLGCLFAYLYDQYESLIPSIVAHSVWNFYASLRDTTILHGLLFIPPGYFVTFLSILLVSQAALFVFVHWHLGKREDRVCSTVNKNREMGV